MFACGELIPEETVLQCAKGGRILGDARVDVRLRCERLRDDAAQVLEIGAEGDETAGNYKVALIAAVEGL